MSEPENSFLFSFSFAALTDQDHLELSISAIWGCVPFGVVPGTPCTINPISTSTTAGTRCGWSHGCTNASTLLPMQATAHPSRHIPQHFHRHLLAALHRDLSWEREIPSKMRQHAPSFDSSRVPGGTFSREITECVRRYLCASQETPSRPKDNTFNAATPRL